jgi:signal transduction histidine kinase
MFQPLNILLVDDQPSKLLTYEAVLAELGENLIKTQSAQEALDFLLKTDIAVVLLDVSMPEIDGYRLADMIRAHPRFRDIAIIFISAIHLTDRDRLQGYEHGAVDYISVPIVPELLRAKVRIFSALYRKTRELETVNHEVRRLSGRILRVQDEERRRIAREIHDGLGQDLMAAKMIAEGIQAPEISGPLSRCIDNAIKQVRSISFLLHPPLLDECGLGMALQVLVDGLSKRSGIEISLHIEPSPFPRLPRELETALYRIVQEALTNVFRHSGGHHAGVDLSSRSKQLVIEIRDDGQGVPDDIAPFRPGTTGVGLAGMAQRCKEFGGEFKIYNGNPGTVVAVSIPAPATKAPAASRTSSRTKSLQPSRVAL